MGKGKKSTRERGATEALGQGRKLEDHSASKKLGDFHHSSSSFLLFALFSFTFAETMVVLNVNFGFVLLNMLS